MFIYTIHFIRFSVSDYVFFGLGGGGLISVFSLCKMDLCMGRSSVRSFIMVYHRYGVTRLPYVSSFCL